MTDQRQRGSSPKSSPVGPLLALGLVLVLLVGGYLLFPVLQAALSRQDCIAAGRVTC